MVAWVQYWVQGGWFDDPIARVWLGSRLRREASKAARNSGGLWCGDAQSAVVGGSWPQLRPSEGQLEDLAADAAITATARRCDRSCGHHSGSSSSKIWPQLRPSQRKQQLEDLAAVAAITATARRCECVGGKTRGERKEGHESRGGGKERRAEGEERRTGRAEEGGSGGWQVGAAVKGREEVALDRRGRFFKHLGSSGEALVRLPSSTARADGELFQRSEGRSCGSRSCGYGHGHCKKGHGPPCEVSGALGSRPDQTKTSFESSGRASGK